jgi:feruloyl esterase
MYSTISLLFLFPLHAFTVLANLDCTADSFSSILPKNTTVTLAAPITQFGSFSQNGVDISLSRNITKEALPICVLELNVQSSANTSFNTGVLLPNSWNGRLMATGNPGFGGGIRWDFQADVLEYGPAVTVSTDTGHVGAPDNISFAINNPDGIIDWSYRSLHESTVLAKQLAKAFYGSDVQHSYYTACSNGGRQGLKEVQMFPNDYDGVLAGAPPWQLTHLHPWAVQLGIWNLPANKSSHIPSSKFPIISDLIMEQCDAQDGLVDQIIQEPYSCNFSSAMITCNATTTNTTACLTPAEIDTLSLFYNDWQAANGSVLFPRFPLSASASRYGEVTTAPDHFGLEYFYGFVYNNTNWDWTTFQGQETVEYVDSLNTGNAAALSMDLSGFKSNGGKLIMYHGLSDTTIPTGSSIEYFQGVNTSMGSIDDFFQLYLIPGMGHVSLAIRLYI